MRLNNEVRARRGRASLRNEKFSRFLRKKPRREMSPYRACYLRRINVKDGKFSPGRGPAPLLHPDGCGLIPCSLSSDSRFVIKKIRCHKLKRKLINQHSSPRLAAHFSALKSKALSDQKPQAPLRRISKSPSSLPLVSKTLAKPLSKKGANKTPRVSFLRLDARVPELDLDSPDDLELEAPSGRVGGAPCVVSLGFETTSLDLSRRPIWREMKAMREEQKRRHLG